MEVDPVPKGLDGRDDARDEILPRQGLEVDRKGLDGASIELPEEFSPEPEEDLRRLGDRPFRNETSFLSSISSRGYHHFVMAGTGSEPDGRANRTVRKRNFLSPLPGTPAS
jgi:hypothetical protein